MYDGHPSLWKARHVDTKIGTTCSLDSSPTSTQSPWIAAFQPSGSLTSTDESFVLPMHNVDTMFQFTFDLTAASLSSDSNPFTSSGSPSSSGGPSSSGTRATRVGKTTYDRLTSALPAVTRGDHNHFPIYRTHGQIAANQALPDSAIALT